MSDAPKALVLQVPPGVQRDGTEFSANSWTDGVWVRFYRGLPKKIGGYRKITDQLRGPIRKSYTWSRASLNAVYTFSSTGIEMLLVDGSGLGASITDRSPSGFSPQVDYVWSVDSQYDDAVGSQGTVILAHASRSLLNIDSDTGSKPYLGLATGSGAFTSITDAPSVSGGVFSIAPYTVCYGSDGYVEWSDANQPQVWTSSSGNIGDAGADRVTGAKIVAGRPTRAGSGVSGILWSLDSVLKMDYVGGNAIFRFSTLSTESSILSQSSIIEYDGVFFWAGLDRFLYFDSSVKELPNTFNLNYFFDNLNYTYRQKVHAVKVPRYGEIWWFYPSGDNVECDKAVIFNVREKCWYDAELVRSSGHHSQVLRFPMWTKNSGSLIMKVGSSTNFAEGDTITGSTTGVAGIVDRIDGVFVWVSNQNGDFSVGETVTTTSGGNTTMSFVDESGIGEVWQQEFGKNYIDGDFSTALQSSVTTPDIGLVSQGVNSWTRLTRVEPDFEQVGNVLVTVLGKEFANSSADAETGYNIGETTDRLDVREQHRHLRIKFESNDDNGDFEMGRPLIHIEPGDRRS